MHKKLVLKKNDLFSRIAQSKGEIPRPVCIGLRQGIQCPFINFSCFRNSLISLESFHRIGGKSAVNTVNCPVKISKLLQLILDIEHPVSAVSDSIQAGWAV